MKNASFVFVLMSLIAGVAASQVYRIVESLQETAFLELFEDGRVVSKSVNFEIAKYGSQDRFVLQTTEQKVYGSSSESKVTYKVMDHNNNLQTMWEKTLFNTEVRLMREFDGLIEVVPNEDWNQPDRVKLYDLKTGDFKISYQSDLNPYSKERPLAVQVSWFDSEMRPHTYFVLMGGEEKVVSLGDYYERMHFTIVNQGVRTRYALRHLKTIHPTSFKGFTCENIHLFSTENDTTGALTVIQRGPDYIAITAALPMDESPEVSGFELRMSCLGMDLSVPVSKGHLDLHSTKGLKAGFDLIML